MLYHKIMDPVSQKMFSIFGVKGKKILKNYLKQLGGKNEQEKNFKIPSSKWISVDQNAGFIRDGVRIPSDQGQDGGFIRGGVRIPSTQYSGTVNDFHDSQYYNQDGGFIRGGVRIPSTQYSGTVNDFYDSRYYNQDGGFIRGGVRIPSTQYSGTVNDFYDSQYYTEKN